MKQQKWMNIYNSILRLRFYAFLELKKSFVINEFDTHFQEFVDDFNLNKNKDKAKFFGGQMLIGLSYLILVRTNEYIKNELSEREAIDVLKIDNWKIIEISSYEAFVFKYNISVKRLKEKNKKGILLYNNDSQKLNYFINKLRNSVSHYRYDTDIDNIILTDINPNNNDIEMKCSLKYSDFLNFCADYGTIVNDTLIKKRIIV
ncbi:hypothetical protein ES676_10905 [Bizionia saleffrena]|uniref:pEK499-p136 HEPN domain-containing protein n=1 Tax=Bizionia saleffrena TaxID=291189 RepID=A0A8H2QEP7_9FLAO|nr:hypothetical protein [Bizionia saleffrena]TYB72675.1 hypothetical protein ES676_10905 [Bizionia saleffrena]